MLLRFIRIASATVETIENSTVADATHIRAHSVFPALKGRAKFSWPLTRQKICSVARLIQRFNKTLYLSFIVEEVRTDAYALRLFCNRNAASCQMLDRALRIINGD